MEEEKKKTRTSPNLGKQCSKETNEKIIEAKKTGYKKRGKYILYKLYKNTNRELWEFRRGEGKKVDTANLQCLRRFRKKGLVTQGQRPL